MKLHHIGVAVKKIEDKLKFYSLLSDQGVRIEDVPQDKVRIAFINLNGVLIELLEPLEDDSPVGRFLAKRGEGLHHLAVEVQGIKEEVQRFRRAGVRMIDETPRQGSQGLLVAFIHPESTGGVLIELCEGG